jgi:hypothetical protein
LPTNCRIFKDKVFPGICEEENQLFKMLGVEYISYHACLNDCILYRGEYEDKEICMKCGHDKYHKSHKNGKSHAFPHKILRHMPIIPRIQRLFHRKELSMLQGWHASHISESGVMRIPIDSIAMKHIENTWPEKFKDEVQSLRLNIAMDGVNPYSL